MEDKVNLIDELEDLGLSSVSENLKVKVKEDEEAKEAKKRLLLAYENYRVVSPDKIERMDKALYERTSKQDERGYLTYDKLRFTNIKHYDKIPPKEAREKLKEALETNLFDEFEVCDIQSVTKVPDPIIFG